MARFFEELAEGEVSLSAARTITDADVRAFADLTGDRNDIHLDEDAARQSRYGRRIAHGAFVFAASVGLLQQDDARRPHIITLMGVERLRFLNPVFIGDTIRARQTVRSLGVVNAESGLLEAAVHVVNQSERVAVSYVAKFLVRRSTR